MLWWVTHTQRHRLSSRKRIHPKTPMGPKTPRGPKTPYGSTTCWFLTSASSNSTKANPRCFSGGKGGKDGSGPAWTHQSHGGAGVPPQTRTWGCSRQSHGRGPIPNLHSTPYLHSRDARAGPTGRVAPQTRSPGMLRPVPGSHPKPAPRDARAPPGTHRSRSPAGSGCR